MTTVKLFGEYECGDQYRRQVDVRDPEPDEDLDGMDGWWEKVVWDHTGNEHLHDEGSNVEAVIVASDVPQLVGAEYEWTNG